MYSACWTGVGVRGLLILSIAAFAARTGADDPYVWAGGSGVWSDGTKWVGGSVPPANATVLIDDGAMVASDCRIDGWPQISGATIDSHDVLRVLNNRALYAYGTILNSGELRLDSLGNGTYLYPADVLILRGGGVVQLSTSTENYIYKAASAGELINDDNLIRGSGHLGWDGSPTRITNSGTVQAGPSDLLYIDSGSATFRNRGLVEAQSGGRVRLQGLVDNIGGVIDAGSGAIELNGCALQGGTLQSSGGGSIYSINPNSVLDGQLGPVRNEGLLRLPNNTAVRVRGPLENVGTLRLESAGNTTLLYPIDTTLELTGGGVIEMSNNGQNWIYKATAGGALHNVDNTIRGAGNIGWSGSPTAITNEGTISANQSNALVIDTGTEWFTNTGVARAVTGGTLRVQGTVDNTGGLIEGADGVVELNACYVRGGTFDSSGGGAVKSISSNTILDGTTEMIVNTGTLQMDNNTAVRGRGTWHNTGTIRLVSGGNTTLLYADDPTFELTGGGVVALSNNSENYIFHSVAGGAFRNVDNTIRGSGWVGWNGSPTPIANEGTIVADQSSPLNIHTANEWFTNTGTVRAINGAALRLHGTVDNTGGLIEGAGGTVELHDCYIRGGTLASSGLGAVASVSYNPILDGTGVPIHNTGLLRIDNSRGLRWRGTLHNAGTVRLNSLGNSTYFYPDDATARLIGGGTVELSASSENYLRHSVGDGALVNVDNTIRGAGHVGDASSPTPITNEASGTIIADRAPWLVLEGQGTTFRNRGNLRAESGARMRMLGNFDNAGGRIRALEASRVELESCTVAGGTFDTDGSGVVAVTGTGSLDGGTQMITNTGLLAIENARTLNAQGELRNEATIHLQSAGSQTWLRPSDVLRLTGGGTVELSSSSENYIAHSTGTGQLINVDNTIRGGGHIGWDGSPTPITNEAAGVISADRSPWLMADGRVTTFRNLGDLRSENGASLRMLGYFDNVGGRIRAVGGGRTELESCTIRGGELTTSTGGTIVVTGTGELDSSTAHLTNAGLIVVENSRLLRVSGALENTGTLRLTSVGSVTWLQAVDAVHLTGGGVVELSNHSENYLARATGAGAIVNVDNTIRGAGHIGWDGSPTPITNEIDGVIQASESNPLILDGRGTLFDNRGLLHASGSGGFDVYGAFATTGRVLISNGSRLDRIGVYEQAGGASEVFGVLTASSGVDLVGGELRGTGAVQANVINRAVVKPGASLGTLAIAGNYAQDPAGELEIELGSLTALDVLTISGAADFGGTLRAAAVNSFVPQIGDRFPALFYGSRSGGFAGFATTGFADSTLSLRVEYGPTSGQIVIVRVGDMNCDGVTTVSDIAGFVLAITDPPAYATQFPDCERMNADINGDGTVTVSDIGPFVTLLTGG